MVPAGGAIPAAARRADGRADRCAGPRATGARDFCSTGRRSVLDDYLAVRPEREAALSALLASGAIEAGPWFVLADELIPGGESLVRNLLAGRRTLRRLGGEAGAPRVLYCPDSFGHPAALPTLARGFGFGTVIAWRGFGGARWPKADTCRWTAPDGEQVVLYHLSRSGYELGANLPVEPGAAAHEVERDPRRAAVAQQHRRGAAAERRRPSRAPAERSRRRSRHSPRPRIRTSPRSSSLAAFVDALEQRAGQLPGLPDVTGELRDSYGFTWTMPGTLATRAHQKRRSARVERLLVARRGAVGRPRGAPGRPRRHAPPARGRGVALAAALPPARHAVRLLDGRRGAGDGRAAGRGRVAGGRPPRRRAVRPDRAPRGRRARTARGMDADGASCGTVRRARAAAWPCSG